MPIKRLIILLTTPRAGSSPIAQILAHYYCQTAGYRNLSEFLNVQSVGVRSEKGIISTFDIRPILSLTHEEVERERKRRWRMLAKSREKYFFKAFPAMLEGKSGNWLKKNTQLIYLARRNLFEHLLSALASGATGEYYKVGGLNFAPGSICAKSTHLMSFLITQQHFKKLLSRVNAPRILFYEDFEKLSPELFLKKIRLGKNVDWDKFQTVERQNKKNKLSFFSNQVEILGWYRDIKTKKVFKI